jgi:hypothetical protein
MHCTFEYSVVFSMACKVRRVPFEQYIYICFGEEEQGSKIAMKNLLNDERSNSK